MRKINLRNPLLIITIIFSAINSYGQNSGLHYIKFLHVGEKIQSVYTLNISYQNGDIPRDSDEIVSDTLHIKSIGTNEKSYKTISNYIKKTNFKFGRDAGKLYFGTFKIIEDRKYYYLPGNSATDYFKSLILYLKRKNCDPEVISAIIENYPWIFNP